MKDLLSFHMCNHERICLQLQPSYQLHQWCRKERGEEEEEGAAALCEEAGGSCE